MARSYYTNDNLFHAFIGNDFSDRECVMYTPSFSGQVLYDQQRYITSSGTLMDQYIGDTVEYMSHHLSADNFSVIVGNDVLDCPGLMLSSSFAKTLGATGVQQLASNHTVYFEANVFVNELTNFTSGAFMPSLQIGMDRILYGDCMPVFYVDTYQDLSCVSVAYEFGLMPAIADRDEAANAVYTVGVPFIYLLDRGERDSLKKIGQSAFLERFSRSIEGRFRGKLRVSAEDRHLIN